MAEIKSDLKLDPSYEANEEIPLDGKLKGRPDVHS